MRSTDDDPLAEQLAPPAPDKTAYSEGRGFTGMEAFWNYIYYQTLGINAFDEFGHLLRIVAFTGGPCSPYSANPTEAVVEQCASWLGPDPAGRARQPDPTEGPEAAAAAADRGGRAAQGASTAAPATRARRAAARQAGPLAAAGRRCPRRCRSCSTA